MQYSKDGVCMDSRSPDIWQLMFEQTPTIIRWVLGVLTLGVFTLAAVLYKVHREDLNKVHLRINELDQRFAHRQELTEARFEARHDQIYRRMEEQMQIPVRIASNTKGGPHG